MKRDELPDGAAVFDNPEYDDALIGEDVNGSAVYDYWKMVSVLVERDNMTPENAVDFIDNTTTRAIPYCGDKSPIIVILNNEW